MTGCGLTVTPPPQQMVNLLTAANPSYSFAALNQGADGATTASWMDSWGGTPLADTLIFITRYGVTAISIMLGTNDAKPENNVSAATYQSNLQSIINVFRTNGVTKIVLNQPPPIKASSSGIPDPTSANALLVTYQVALSNLAAVDPTHVYLGDQTAYAAFNTNAATYYQADGIHPSDAGATALAGLWEASYPV